jgi:hypothetical protein
VARINVEQKALTDPRFHRLGHDLGAESQHAQAVGLYVMVRVWNECIEKGAHVLDGWLLQAITGRIDGADLIASSELAVPLKGNRYRIKGAKGRVEYLEEKRRLARENGLKGGRPRKPTSVSKTTGVGVPAETPPAPAPAPAFLREDPPEDSESDSSAPSAATEPAVASFACVGTGPKTWDATEASVEGWKVAYPGVDVIGELRRMGEWLRSNPKRRKTAEGMRRFVTGWLAKEQNRAPAQAEPKARRITDPSDSLPPASTPMGNAEWARQRQQAIRELIAAGTSREEAARQVNERFGIVAP